MIGIDWYLALVDCSPDALLDSPDRFSIHWGRLDLLMM